MVKDSGAKGFAAETNAQGWQGQLQLEFTGRQAGKETGTILSRSYAQAPLKVQRPFYPEGETVCHSVILHTAGGIVGGDRLAQTILLHPQAQALITTAAATKVYGSKGTEAQQTTQIRVMEGACLEWLPQETIVFDGAIYRQHLQIELDPTATWLGWEITRLGRSARGERFLSGEWRTRTEVWQQGRLLWLDPQWLQGGSEILQSPFGLANCPVVGSFAFIGRSVSPELVQQVRALWTDRNLETPSKTPESPSFSSTSADTGTTRLPLGLLCRYRGHSTLEARRWFIQVWHLLRQVQLGRDCCIPRIWQL